jgi:hypothetical protein
VLRSLKHDGLITNGVDLGMHNSFASKTVENGASLLIRSCALLKTSSSFELLKLRVSVAGLFAPCTTLLISQRLKATSCATISCINSINSCNFCLLEISSTIPPSPAGASCGDFFASRYENHSTSRLVRFIDNRRIWIIA